MNKDNIKLTMETIINNFPIGVLELLTTRGNTLQLLLNDKKYLTSLLIYLKEHQDFKHLAKITNIDYINDNIFALVYNLFSYSSNIRILLFIYLKRSEPEIDTVSHIWPQAQAYEQIVHEFFGIVFNGNPDLSPLILHNWKDIPPLRKDFDTEAYSRKAFAVDEVKK